MHENTTTNKKLLTKTINMSGMTQSLLGHDKTLSVLPRFIMPVSFCTASSHS